ncbi:MAG: alkaline phosphatase D family protein [Thermoleophilaceae bacterium]
MRRFLIAAAALAVVAIVPSTASAAGFSYGVASADVTSTSALLWAHAPKAGKAHLEVALDSRFTRKRIAKTVFAKKANDLTVQSRVAGLIPGRRYYFFFHEGAKRSVLGTFKTAPKPTTPATVRFAVTGDTDGFKTSNAIPFYNQQGFYGPFGSNSFEVFKRMAAEKNDFNVNLGDTMYSEAPEKSITEDVALGPTAFSLAAKRAKYRQNLSYANLQKVRSSGAMFNHWDDHEFNDDFTPNSAACMYGRVFDEDKDAAQCNEKQVYAAGVKAFREYMPVTYSSANGIYRRFKWGKNVELFFLDERSFRSIHASEVKVDPNAAEPTAHVCDNEGQADPAPQVPQRIRDLFTFIYPPAKNPPPQACLDAINDPSRTMLGTAQYNAFTNAIKASKATWKVVVNEVPIMGAYVNPYDDWQGYMAERQKLLHFLQDNVKNVVFLTTDFHSNWVADASYSVFPEEGGLQPSGIMDFVGGGVADGTFGYEIDDFTDKQDNWKLINGAFYAKPPPDGPGMLCSNPVTYGYLQVSAAARKLSVALKDSKGKTITDIGSAKPCGPYVLTAK